MRHQSEVIASWKRWLMIAAMVTVTLPVAGRIRQPAAEGHPSEPAIQITVIPPKGGGPDRLETIAGTAGGVDFKEHSVVIFCRTNTWYVQPFADSPYTSIDERGKWQTEIHLGLEYAALLVKPSYKPPATTNMLPAVGGLVLAVARVPAKTQSERRAELRKLLS